MKKMRNIFAMLVAMVMVFAMGAVAFAAEGAPTDTSISVTGLEAGDTVNFYKVLKFDETATDTGGWVAAQGFTDLTKDQIQKIVGTGEYATGKSKANEAGIDAGLAGIISKMAQDSDVNLTANANSDGTATANTNTVGTAGLYVALVTPATADTLYNPVFVAADYTDGGSYTQAAATTLSYSPKAMAKKEKVTLTKEIDGEADVKYDVNIGDDVSFTITSQVPAYSTAYENPTYEITDTMEAGLVLKTVPVVNIDGIELADTDYTVTPGTISDDVTTFKVVLTAAGLAKVSTTGQAQNITVTYKATVKSIENATVTEKTNEATVKFSNNPDDSTSYSLLEDKTRTYTFTIDGSLLGYTGASYETDELIKVGLNADGTPATTTQQYHSGTTWSKLSPLAGAKFALYTSEPTASDYASEEAAKASGKIYKNSVEKDGIIVSDENGRLKIEGLDEGTYYLREVSAPTGYIADNRTFTITIEATFDNVEGGTYTNSDNILVKYDAYKILHGYTVTVNDGTNGTTSSYTIDNKGPVHHEVVDKATYIEKTGEGGGDFAGDSVTPISNTQGTELPSTGGIGTTIFYIVGGVMVAGAAIFLLTKRRMAGNE